MVTNKKKYKKNSNSNSSNNNAGAGTGTGFTTVPTSVMTASAEAKFRKRTGLPDTCQISYGDGSKDKDRKKNSNNNISNNNNNNNNNNIATAGSNSKVNSNPILARRPVATKRIILDKDDRKISAKITMTLEERLHETFELIKNVNVGIKIEETKEAAKIYAEINRAREVRVSTKDADTALLLRDDDGIPLKHKFIKSISGLIQAGLINEKLSENLSRLLKNDDKLNKFRLAKIWIIRTAVPIRKMADFVYDMARKYNQVLKNYFHGEFNDRVKRLVVMADQIGLCDSFEKKIKEIVYKMNELMVLTHTNAKANRKTALDLLREITLSIKCDVPDVGKVEETAKIVEQRQKVMVDNDYGKQPEPRHDSSFLNEIEIATTEREIKELQRCIETSVQNLEKTLSIKQRSIYLDELKSVIQNKYDNGNTSTSSVSHSGVLKKKIPLDNINTSHDEEQEHENDNMFPTLQCVHGMDPNRQHYKLVSAFVVGGIISLSDTIYFARNKTVQQQQEIEEIENKFNLVDAVVDIKFKKSIFFVATTLVLVLLNENVINDRTPDPIAMLLHWGIRMTYQSIPKSRGINVNPGTVWYAKYAKYYRDIATIRGAINICARETKVFCSCMNTLRAKSKLMKKDGMCDNCGIIFPKKELKYCGGCMTVQYCSAECKNQNWFKEGGHKKNCIHMKFQRCNTCRIIRPQSQLKTCCSDSINNDVGDDGNHHHTINMDIERQLALDYVIEVYPIGMSLLRRCYNQDDDAEEEDDEYLGDGQRGKITNHKDGYIEVSWVSSFPFDVDFEATTLQIYDPTEKLTLHLLRTYNKNCVSEVAPSNENRNERDATL